MQSNFDHKFRPRGIDKWHAFAALVSGDEQKESAIEIETLRFDYFDEYYDDLNLIMNEAYNEKKKVKITFLDNNQYHELEGYITKIDDYSQRVTLEKTKILMKNIYSIELV